MDISVWYCDFGQSKPVMVQNIIEMIAEGYLATKRQINKLCIELFTGLCNSDSTVNSLLLCNRDNWK